MRIVLTFFWLSLACIAISQPDTIIIGYGGVEGLQVTTSSSTVGGTGSNTTSIENYIPNENSASRFLTQATLGFGREDIDHLVDVGISDWLETQFAMEQDTTLLGQAEVYRQYVLAQTSDPGTTSRFWRYAWWQYHMTQEDYLRQRVALALSEIFVISQESSFGSIGHALADYYDILISNAFGNYRELMERVSMHPAMGVYLTSLNNAKTDIAQNRFPDENYAREIMQLFSIGTTMLNDDGSEIFDTDGIAVPSYDNDDITELSKVFTGLTWWNRTQFGRNALNLDSWLDDMVMWNTFHEPGEKVILKNDTIQDRNPIDGIADIQDAIDIIFNHPNVPPFVSKILIQRLVTANPSPQYITRVSNVFKDNGNGVRGDMKAVISAILLDNEARECEYQNGFTYGSLKEPFLRYFQIHKAFNVSTASGDFRNDMRSVFDQTSQRPLNSPTVFNFFQRDYVPIGPVEDAELVAPVFQITDTQSISGYINGLFRWIMSEKVADEADLYGGEPNEDYADEVSYIDYSSEMLLVNDDEIHVLLDDLNLTLASGRLSQRSLDIIKNAVLTFPSGDDSDREYRVKLAIYLIMSSPEYLIIR